jgi:hypothetical protein
MVWDEAKIVRRRINQQYRTQAVVMHAAAGAAQAGGKNGAKALNTFLENFDDG